MPSKLVLLAVLSFATIDLLHAQCPINPEGSPQPHLSGSGYCSTLWDPDGAGPLPQRLVVGGNTLLGGSQLLGGTLPSIQRVMTWDGSTWQPLGGGPGTNLFGIVSDLISWNGVLVAGGTFTTPGGPDYIAQWNGSAWQSLGTGAPTNVDAFAIWNGDLVVAGHTGSGTGTTLNLHTWNGATWSALPAPPALDQPTAMVTFEGELIVAGSQHLPLSTQHVLERWNGSSWATTIGSNGGIAAMAVRTNLAVGGSDTLIVGGAFTNLGGTAVANVARTNGAPSFAWSSIGGGLPTTCMSLLVHNSGLTNYTVVARTSSPSTPVMRYTTSSGSWTSIGGLGFAAITSYAGTYHGVNVGSASPCCHRYDGSSWVPVRGPGVVGEVRAAVASGGDTILGGTFAEISGVATNGIARWDGSTFTPLGTGMVGSSVEALVRLDNGDIVAGGNFVAAGGIAANHIARWNGTSWSPMGNGFDAPVYALCTMPNGDVIAGGAFTQEVGAPVLCNHVARWNGTAWSPMDLGMNNDVLALVVRNDGRLFAGGRFTIASTFSRYYVTYWTGSLWGQVGTAMNAPVHGLAARPNGDIVAVGEFTQASLLPMDRIARWNGSAWVTMGAASGNPGVVRAVHCLPNGDIVAGRGFHQPSAIADSGISRWNGSSWNGFSYLTSHTTSAPVQVLAFAQRADGDLVVGGSFHTAGMSMAYDLAAFQSTCMPSAAPYGNGCTSAAGPLSITADTLPWIGAAFRTTTTGVAPGSPGVGLIGLTQLSIPLPTLLPEGQPGCSLYTTPDAQLLLTNGPGDTATSSFALGNDASLIGVPFFQQTIALEFGAGGAITAIRGSNALSLVIGTL
jgi:hypothetical protein